MAERNKFRPGKDNFTMEDVKADFINRRHERIKNEISRRRKGYEDAKNFEQRFNPYLYKSTSNININGSGELNYSGRHYKTLNNLIREHTGIDKEIQKFNNSRQKARRERSNEQNTSNSNKSINKPAKLVSRNTSKSNIVEQKKSNSELNNTVQGNTKVKPTQITNAASQAKSNVILNTNATNAPQKTASTKAPAKLVSRNNSNSSDYKIERGDTLYAIAKKFTGNGNAYKELLKYNNIDNQNKIYVGDNLKIPDSWKRNSKYKAEKLKKNLKFTLPDNLDEDYAKLQPREL